MNFCGNPQIHSRKGIPMNPTQRKQLVVKILSKAKEETSKEVELIKNAPDITMDFLQIHIRNYVLSKYLLSSDCEETNIKELAKVSLARTMKIDPKMIRQLDQATPCDHATSESAKKVLLLYAVQTDFHLPENPEKLSNVETLEELAEYVYEALPRQNRND
jgi:hypothetical protein